jgi:holliday junction DNA helicase RuvA
MIEWLSGYVKNQLPGGIVLDVGGVGYGLSTTQRVSTELGAASDKVEVYVHTHVREDSIRLFGFATYAEKRVFEILISVNGVGPKLAMTILEQASLDGLINAVNEEDVAFFENLPGIGNRTAKKLLLELKPKFAKTAETLEITIKSSGTAKSKWSDLKSMLVNLGFSGRDLEVVVDELREKHKDSDLDGLLRHALARLATKPRTKERAAELPF